MLGIKMFAEIEPLNKEFMKRSSESSGLSLTFHKFEDIADSDWALNVPDKVSFIGLFTRN